MAPAVSLCQPAYALIPNAPPCPQAQAQLKSAGEQARRQWAKLFPRFRLEDPQLLGSAAAGAAAAGAAGAAAGAAAGGVAAVEPGEGHGPRKELFALTGQQLVALPGAGEVRAVA
jgi:hypothetical protein